MSDTLYDIIFNGQTVTGANPDTVKKNLATLFKSDPAKIDALFTGKPKLLKKGLSEAQAAKFQAALKKAGAEVVVRAQSTDQAPPAQGKPSLAERLAAMEENDAPAPSPAPESSPGTTAPAARAPKAKDGMQVMPPGTYTEPGETAEPVSVDIGHLDTEDYERLSPEAPPPPPPPDTSDLSTADGYERLSEEAPPPPPAPDTSHLDVADVGADIGTPKEDVPERTLSELADAELAPPGEDLLKPEERKPAAPTDVPDVSHLSVKD